jgi:hypothetical protein
VDKIFQTGSMYNGLVIFKLYKLQSKFKSEVFFWIVSFGNWIQFAPFWQSMDFIDLYVVKINWNPYMLLKMSIYGMKEMVPCNFNVLKVKSVLKKMFMNYLMIKMFYVFKNWCHFDNIFKDQILSVCFYECCKNLHLLYTLYFRFLRIVQSII